MAVSIVNSSAVVSNGGNTGGDLSATPTMPASTANGDRVFVFVTSVSSVATPAGWTLMFYNGGAGGGDYGVGTGPRQQTIFYRDKNASWSSLPTFTSAGFWGIQNAIAVAAMTVRKGAGEVWREPYPNSFGNDITAGTGYSASTPPEYPLGIAFNELVVVMDAFPGTTTVSSPSISSSGVAMSAVTQRVASGGTTGGWGAALAVFSASVNSGVGNNTVTHTANLGTSRTGGTAFVVLSVFVTRNTTLPTDTLANTDTVYTTKVDSPDVERVPAYEAKFDPRTGNTGYWMGGDVAASVPLGDSRNRIVWIFGDTFYRSSLSPNPPTNRVNWRMYTQSIGVQTGLDLATADVQFYSGGGSQGAWGAGGTWFNVPGGAHQFWPHAGVMVGNDLYVMAIRVVAGDPYSTEAGWAMGRIPNVKETNPNTWVASVIYQSANTNVRPIGSPYVEGGYVYSFALEKHLGWHFCRWTLANFTGNNTQGNIEYWTGSGWSTIFANSRVIYYNVLTAEGSFHKRDDGRWVRVDTTLGGTANGRGTVGVSAMVGGTFHPANDYHVPGPQLQPGDRFTDTINLTGFILAVLPNGDRVVRYDDIFSGEIHVKPISELTLQSNSSRHFYSHPRGEVETEPSYQVYSWRAHPELANSGGLITTYCDNQASDIAAPYGTTYDLSVYYPKFVRIKPPTISNFTYSYATGVATWVTTGAPDRQFYRVNEGAWVEISATATSVTLPPNSYVEIMARGVGGDTVVSSYAPTKLRVGTATPSKLMVGASIASGAYAGTILV